jgi:signal transduction histidine kinase
VGNVFAHTEPGIGFEVATGRSDGVAWLVVSDEGPGLPGSWIGERGVSGAGSTGLGLDIARRTAEMGGGTLEMGDRPRGGAVVTVRFG